GRLGGRWGADSGRRGGRSGLGFLGGARRRFLVARHERVSHGWPRPGNACFRKRLIDRLVGTLGAAWISGCHDDPSLSGALGANQTPIKAHLLCGIYERIANRSRRDWPKFSAWTAAKRLGRSRTDRVS